MGKDQKKVRILFYGDSNTFGYDPRGYCGGRYAPDIRWTDRLAAKTADKAEVFADGMNGRSVPDSGYAVRAVLEELSRLSPDLFSVMLGSNDLLDSVCTKEETVRDTVSRMERFLKQLTEKTERTGKFRVLVLSPPQIEKGSWGSAALEEERVMLADSYREMSDRNGWMFLDTALWKCPLSFDGVHLSEEGHIQFAERMAGLLGSLQIL